MSKKFSSRHARTFYQSTNQIHNSEISNLALFVIVSWHKFAKLSDIPLLIVQLFMIESKANIYNSIISGQIFYDLITKLAKNDCEDWFFRKFKTKRQLWVTKKRNFSKKTFCDNVISIPIKVIFEYCNKNCFSLYHKRAMTFKIWFLIHCYLFMKICMNLELNWTKNFYCKISFQFW